jgi:TetR/AcrR family transcriptional repressor of nem operon
MQRSDTKNRILSEAEALTRARGFSGFSYADLSERIGIQKASIHHHFASKEELGLALIASYRERCLSRMAEILVESPSAVVRLQSYAALYVDGLKKGLACLCGMMASETALLPAEMQENIRRFFDEHQRWLALVLQDGKWRAEVAASVHPDKKSAELLATLQGAMFMARLTGTPGLIEQIFSGALSSIEVRQC